MPRDCKCKQCGGTGKVILMNSGFKADGYRREGCGICGGTGISSFQPDRDFARWQAQRRAEIATA